jgi:metallophosphoesterase superfamily enzyme
VVILPFVELLPEEVILLLNEFLHQGGIILTYNSNDIMTVRKSGKHPLKAVPSSLQKDKCIALRHRNELLAECQKHLHPSYEISDGESETYRTQMNYPNRIHDPYLHDGENVFGIGFTIPKNRSYFLVEELD